MTTAVPLPPNSTAFERTLVELDGRVLEIDADVIRRAKDPATCPEELLPWLAWEETVDVWEPDWPVSKKREAIAQSWSLHRIKGTGAALEQAINLLGFGARIEEWFEYGGAPYLFRLTVELGPEDALSFERMVSMTRTALRFKNVRSHLETIFLRRFSPPTPVYVGGYITLRTTMRNSYDPFEYLAVAGRAHIGASAVSRHRIRLG